MFDGASLLMGRCGHVGPAIPLPPLPPSTEQIHECFDALLEVIQLQAPPPALSGAALAGAEDEDEAFFASAARRLLDLPYIRKGRYLPLASLVRARGAGWLLAMRPDLIRQMLLAMQVGLGMGM